MPDEHETVFEQCKAAYCACLRGDPDVTKYPIIKNFRGDPGSRLEVGEYLADQVPPESRNTLYADFVVAGQVRKVSERDVFILAG